MRKIILTIAFLFLGAMAMQAQKYAFVDTDYILRNIPEYNDAQAILEDLATQWQKEIEDKFTAIDKLYKDYQAEAILLPEDLKKQRENEIIQKEKEAKELQKKRFGKEGDLFKKRVELIQPIQEKVYNAIEEIANERTYVFVFDKAAGATLLYAQSKLDLSDDVLDQIGAVMQTIRREDRVKPSYQGTESSKPSQGNTGTQDNLRNNPPVKEPIRK